MPSRAEPVYKAKMAEQAERYDQMTNFVDQFAKLSKESGEPLTVEERNLLSVAYKNSVGSRRASWRIISSVESRSTNGATEEETNWATDYKKEIETELEGICQRCIDLIEKTLLAGKDLGAEPTVFYYKMKGDYHRYIAEFKVDDCKKKAAEAATQAYQAAMDAAQNPDTGLSVTHPIRLGLALNFSVFYYEVIGNDGGVDGRAKACDMARQAFEDAIAQLDNVSEDSYKDATLIMQLLRDNLTLWTSTDEDQ